ncbi:MAG TPA: hypothetical protein VK348_05595 [Planctomycetota bacterium]|nr:hypothetical protein [Planctomycetota bacterium]
MTHRACFWSVFAFLAAGCATEIERAAPSPLALERAAAAPLAVEQPGTQAPAGNAPSASKEGDRTLLVGLGFTDGPETFLIGGEADFYLSDRLAVGPMLQWGVDDHVTILAPSFHAKYLFPLERAAGAPEFVPFVQGGAGFAYIKKDRRPGDDDGIGLLLQAGGGIECRLDKGLTLASTALIDLLPAEVVGEHVYFSWQIVQFGFRF